MLGFVCAVDYAAYPLAHFCSILAAEPRYVGSGLTYAYRIAVPGSEICKDVLVRATTRAHDRSRRTPLDPGFGSKESNDDYFTKSNNQNCQVFSAISIEYLRMLSISRRIFPIHD